MTKDKERTDRKPNWREVYATVEDIRQFLSENALLRYNTVTGRVEGHVIDEDPWDELVEQAREGTATEEALMAAAAEDERQRRRQESAADCWQPITERDENTLWARLSRQKPVRKQDLHNVMHSDYVPDYNPFQAYLDALPPWDGRDDYIMELRF